MRHYNTRQNDDMLFLHTGDLDLPAQHSVLALCGEAHARFQLLDHSDTTVPPGSPPSDTWVQRRRFSVGYRHMIRFFAVGIWGLVAREGYRFVMRLDEDSFLRSPVEYNLFESLEAKGVDYAYRLATWESGATPKLFFRWVRQYLLEAKNVTPAWLTRILRAEGLLGPEDRVAGLEPQFLMRLQDGLGEH